MMVMDSDSTAIISESSEQVQPPEPQAMPVEPQAMPVESQATPVALTVLGPAKSGNELNWPARFKMSARRSAAGFIDLTIMSALSLFFLGLPVGASLAFNIWEHSANSAPTLLSNTIEHGLQFAAAMAILNQLYFYTALAESGRAQASLGKILFGLKTTDARGNRQTIGGVLGRLSLKYTAFVLLCLGTYGLVSFAADFIPSLHIEQLRTLLKVAIVAASFALCMVTDREQNLYDIITGRLVVLDETGSARERLRHFASELGAIFLTLNPLAPFIGAKKYQGDTSNSKDIVAILLVLWTYISTATGMALLFFASQIGLSMSEIESGIVAQSKQQNDLAAGHFKKALTLCPGVAQVYQNYYMLNDNIDLVKQDAACVRLFAVRGNAQDYLARARIRAKQLQYQASESDYKEALSGRHGQLAPGETEAANTEWAMLKLEEEAASIPSGLAQPMHTAPLDTGAPDSPLK
jgi:uncharacterized RDD family membrane protein YckC